jgi:hypothetical protein
MLEKDGQLEMRVAVEAENPTLRLAVAAKGPAEIKARDHFITGFFRVFANGSPLGAFRLAVQRDSLPVASAPVMPLADQTVGIPGLGFLPLVGVAPSFSFVRNQELWLAFEPAPPPL